MAQRMVGWCPARHATATITRVYPVTEKHHWSSDSVPSAHVAIGSGMPQSLTSQAPANGSSRLEP